MRNKNLVLFTCLLLMYVLSACSSDYGKIIEKNWDITLPKGYEEIVSVDSGASFQGDGERYHVFKYKEELKKEEIQRFSSRENSVVEDEVKKILNSLQVSNEERPDFSKTYYWYTQSGDDDSRDKLYLIYFNEDNLLYVVEEFY